MNTTEQNIYRLKKHDWTPLLKFGGGQSRAGQSAGWHNNNPYDNPNTRTLGVRYLDPSQVIQQYDVAFRGNYTNYSPTDNNWTMDVKYDVSRLSSIWYRYRYVNQIIPPLTSMPELAIISLRDHMVPFGDMDLSNCSKFTHLELSSHFSIEGDIINGQRAGGSANSITFHPNANLKFVYISGCDIPQSFVDACLIQCYNQRNNIATYGYTIPSSSIPSTRIDEGYDPAWNRYNNSFLSQRVSWSASLQYMVDELINDYGWTGFAFY